MKIETFSFEETQLHNRFFRGQLPDRVDDLPERPFLARHRRRPEWAGESSATSLTASGDNRLQLLETGQNQSLLRQLKFKLNQL